MTDEQLRAMARRVLGLLCEYRQRRHPLSDTNEMVYATGQTWHNADEIEAQAVAILREEMDKCPKCGSNDTLACCCECGVYWGKDGIREPVKITAAIYDPADDPTQSFVATT